uniref:Sorbitol dehydrogenase n=1 Tax=Enterobacter agglomerans TaxID=549 RepID=Q52TA3_ENTAG|nr:sorbitol dehydrogenase [Pantoea agglomerans]
MNALKPYEERDMPILEADVRTVESADVVYLTRKLAWDCWLSSFAYSNIGGSTGGYVCAPEFSGEVIASGSEVTDIEIGDRDAGCPALYCGECEYCKKGEFARCRKLTGPDGAAYQQGYLRVVGGEIWHWAGCAWRYLPSDFELHSRCGDGRDWAIKYADLEPFYYQAEVLLGVAGPNLDVVDLGSPRSHDYPVQEVPLSYGADQFRKLILEKTNYRVVHEPQARNTRPFDKRPTCEGNNNCVPICPIGAVYNGIHSVNRAEAAGARIIPTAVVGFSCRSGYITYYICTSFCLCEKRWRRSVPRNWIRRCNYRTFLLWTRFVTAHGGANVVRILCISLTIIRSTSQRVWRLPTISGKSWKSRSVVAPLLPFVSSVITKALPTPTTGSHGAKHIKTFWAFLTPKSITRFPSQQGRVVTIPRSCSRNCWLGSVVLILNRQRVTSRSAIRRAARSWEQTPPIRINIEPVITHRLHLLKDQKFLSESMKEINFSGKYYFLPR